MLLNQLATRIPQI